MSYKLRPHFYLYAERQTTFTTVKPTNRWEKTSDASLNQIETVAVHVYVCTSVCIPVSVHSRHVYVLAVSRERSPSLCVCSCTCIVV